MRALEKSEFANSPNGRQYILSEICRGFIINFKYMHISEERFDISFLPKLASGKCHGREVFNHPRTRGAKVTVGQICRGHDELSDTGVKFDRLNDFQPPP